MARRSATPTFGMQHRSAHLDFYIRDKSGLMDTSTPHRHEYFQIQVNQGADTVQHIGAAIRPFSRQTLAFILPHRLHMIPHPPGGQSVLINFTPEFLLPHLACDPMDLEDLDVATAPELSPFLCQEHLDFHLSDPAFGEVEQLLQQMKAIDQARHLGSGLRLKGLLLTLIGLVCQSHERELLALSVGNAALKSRRAAMGRVTRYIRDHLGNPALSLTDAAAAAYLSPNYLSHLCAKETGCSFSELVSGRRLRMARTQLINTDDALGQIARQCGFTDEAYFSRCFRKAFGIPPGQFRRQHRGAW